jgi:heme exporter protein A
MSARGPFQDKPKDKIGLRVEALSLSRGPRVLFENLSFAAASGAYVEVQGSNGSGKTSLLRALAGLLRPRSGVIAFDGVEEPTLATHYLGHDNGLKREASVRDHVRYWEGLFGVSYAATRETAAAEKIGLAAFGLHKQAELPVRVLSQGQARRLALMRLHIAPRPIWLLDEPAAGLDADARIQLAEFIQSHCVHGGIAIAAMHEPLGLEPAQVITIGSP